jgi:hypothetical protein
MDINDLLINELPNPTLEPFPHIVSDSTLNLDILEQILAEFPDIEQPGWNGDRNFKMEMGRDSQIWPKIGQEVFKVLLGKDFCELLSAKFCAPELTGTTFGAGYHISTYNSYLPMHIDWQKFNGLYRWINVHIYLNKNWTTEQGGELNFNNKLSIAPKFGRFVAFLSSTNSRHGHPNPWKSELPRKSIAVYYFGNKIVPGYDPAKNSYGEIIF